MDDFLEQNHCFSCNYEVPFYYRCSFHSYADSTYAKHLEAGGQSIYGTLGGPTPIPSVTPTPMMEASVTMRAETPRDYQQSVIEVSEDSINSIDKVEEWKSVLSNGNVNNNVSNGRMPNGASPRENGNGLFFNCKATPCF